MKPKTCTVKKYSKDCTVLECDYFSCCETKMDESEIQSLKEEERRERAEDFQRYLDNPARYSKYD